jgi:hypothetical protein
VDGRGGIGDFFVFALRRSPETIGKSIAEGLADRTRVSVSGKAGIGPFGANASIRADRQTLQDGTVSVSARSELGTVGAKAEATVDLRIIGPPVSNDTIRQEISASLGVVGATVTLAGTIFEPKVTVAVKAGPQIGITLKGGSADALKTPVTAGVGGGTRVDVAALIRRAIAASREARQCTEEGCR